MCGREMMQCNGRVSENCAKRRSMGVTMEEMAGVQAAFIGVGCNRVVGAAAWGPCGLAAFGAHHSVAIFDPQTAKVVTTLPGHKDVVNCVEWIPRHLPKHLDGVGPEEKFLLSGSADGGILLWAYHSSQIKWRLGKQMAGAHKKAVTCIAGYQLTACSALCASTSSNGTVHIWQASLPMQAGGECDLRLVQSINAGLKVMVAVTLSCLPDSSDTFLLAMGGLDNQVHLYVGASTGQFSPVCHLKGHQDWIRALDFSLCVKEDAGPAVFLASSAQDRIIRMWRISRRKAASLDSDSHIQPSLKMYIEGPIFKAGGILWQVSLESLLVGHEDWVYSVRWQPPQETVDGHKNGTCGQSMCVLSASMDRTMMIWRPDSKSGIWMNVVTVGELGQTALGFYGGVWGPYGNAILAHGYSGSLHLWRDGGKDSPEWRPWLVPSGHSKPVVDLAWGKTDQFLLSGSHDQTTRVFSCWKRKEDDEGKGQTWHEIARPQVHGHDLNCLALIKGSGNHRYVSGADEKVARVFEAPRAFLDSLAACTGITDAAGPKREDVQIVGANMSALGLSQKPIYLQETGARTRESGDPELDPLDDLPEAIPVALTEPPLEEHLAHHTLWPEAHKLYGHGNELFAMCSDHAGHLLATACKAQISNVAEIWLWHVNSWRVAGRLQSHTLTVTQMEFSHDDRFLVSVSRDRHLSVFQLTQTGVDDVQHNLVTKVEAHKRIIWACSWSPCDRVFATGSRDKTVKIWNVSETREGSPQVQLNTTLPIFRSSITALAWAPSAGVETYVLALGKEDGSLELWKGSVIASAESLNSLSFQGLRKLEMSCVSKLDAYLCHSATVHRVCWKGLPVSLEERQAECQGKSLDKDVQSLTLQLATCGADHTVRIFNVTLR